MVRVIYRPSHLSIEKPTLSTSCLYSLLSQSWIINLQNKLSSDNMASCKMPLPSVALPTIKIKLAQAEMQGNLPPGRRSFWFITIWPTATLALPSSVIFFSSYKFFSGHKAFLWERITYDEVELVTQRYWLVNVTPKEKPLACLCHFALWPPIFFPSALMWQARLIPLHQVHSYTSTPRHHIQGLSHLFSSYMTFYFLVWNWCELLPLAPIYCHAPC